MSLPALRQLLEVPLSDGAQVERIKRTVQFSTGGLGTYFTNQNQVNSIYVEWTATKLIMFRFKNFQSIKKRPNYY